MSLEAFKVSHRTAEPEDVPFVLSTWLKSYKHDSPTTGAIHAEIFYKNHEPVIKRILSKPEARAIICCEEADPNFILGYVVYEVGEKPLLHFCYIKKLWREENLIREGLLRAAGFPELLEGCEFTHWTSWVTDEKHKGLWRGIYNPYKAYIWRSQ